MRIPTRKYLLLFRWIILIVLLPTLLFSCQSDPPKHHLGFLQWTESVDPYRQTYRGIINSLSDKGYRQDTNLIISYVNVEQDMEKAAEAAKHFVDSGVEILVSLGTGSSIAALEATKLSKTPVIFSIVGAPKATGIINSFDDAGRNITGVSMKVPVTEQFTVAKDILPWMQKLGILYCDLTPQAVATANEALQAAEQFGWQVESKVVEEGELVNLATIANSLASDVDAIYIPTDPILGTPANLKTILSETDRNGTPVIGVAEKFVEQGVLAALHSDFYEIGRQTSDSIVQVIKGVRVEDIPSQRPLLKKISINLKKAEQLNIEIDRNVILRADNIID